MNFEFLKIVVIQLGCRNEHNLIVGTSIAHPGHDDVDASLKRYIQISSE